jgi:hypothetical protein
MSKRPASSKKAHFTDAQNSKLRAIVESELCSRVPRQLHLAPFLGVTQASLSRFLDGSTGASAALAMRVASLLNRSVEDVLGVTEVPAFVDDQEARYPSRILAARSAYLDGVPLKHIHAVLSASLDFDGDPGPVWWLKMMTEGELAKPGNRRDTSWALSYAQPPGWDERKRITKRSVKHSKKR